MIEAAGRWLDDRLGVSRFARTSLKKIYPDHWSFLLGEFALYSFVIIVMTGVFLTFFFDAST
ncbi:MAG TPA: cytochrome b, partial [Acidimicrobiales bacterium]|nr:cytochrome b [Acidimicrobiales bacterium]